MPCAAALLALLAAAGAARLDPLPDAVRREAQAVRWTAPLVERLIREMPKVETHVHLDGTLSPALVQELATAQGLPPFAGRPLEDIRRLCVVDQPLGSLAEVLAPFPRLLPLLRRPDALERAALELVRSSAAHKVRHVEVRFAPALHETAELPMEGVLGAVLRGLEQGRRETGVGSAVIVCLIRPFELVSRAKNEEMLRLAVRHAGRGVVGIDLAGDESAAPLLGFRDLYLRAKKAGLATTAHAGEVPGSRDVETALELGVDRIGHATVLARDPVLMARVADRGLPLEINLTSNVRTRAVPSYADHPVRVFRAAGIPITLSTDDPGLFGIDLDHEYDNLAREVGFGPEAVLSVSFQGVAALFLPEAHRAALRREFESTVLDLLRHLRESADSSN